MIHSVHTPAVACAAMRAVYPTGMGSLESPPCTRAPFRDDANNYLLLRLSLCKAG